MISAFQSDFSLARDGDRKLSDLDELIKNKNSTLLKDIELLEELEWMLRTGNAEIHIHTKILKLKMIKTEDCVYISQANEGWANFEDYLFDGEKIKRTKNLNWYELSKKPQKIVLQSDPNKEVEYKIITTYSIEEYEYLMRDCIHHKKF